MPTCESFIALFSALRSIRNGLLVSSQKCFDGTFPSLPGSPVQKMEALYSDHLYSIIPTLIISFNCFCQYSVIKKGKGNCLTHLIDMFWFISTFFRGAHSVQHHKV